MPAARPRAVTPKVARGGPTRATAATRQPTSGTVGETPGRGAGKAPQVPHRGPAGGGPRSGPTGLSGFRVFCFTRAGRQAGRSSPAARTAA